MRLPIEILCEQIENDYLLYTNISRKYPQSFLKVKYEDLASHTKTEVERMYAHLNEDVPRQVIGYIQESQDVSWTEDNKAFGVIQTDSNRTAFEWRSRISANDLTMATEKCSRAIKLLGYKM